MKPVIKAVNLKKNYTSGNYKTEAVKNVSIDIYPGEKIAITGPSGCGKTTLLNMIGLVIKPTGGEIFIDDENTINLSDKKCAEYRNRFFGYVVQEFALIEEESVMNNIEIPLLYSKKKISRLKRKNKIEAALGEFGIEGKAWQKVKNLSGGERQRVAIVRAIINNPEIILADEPTGSLDSKNTEDVFKILSSLSDEGKTLILVTHNEELAKRCDREIHMIDGRITV